MHQLHDARFKRPTAGARHERVKAASAHPPVIINVSTDK